jgi:hypothetical protein
MPNMKHLEVLGITLADWMKLPEAEKVEANKKAAQLISDAHPKVTISHESPNEPSTRSSRNRHGGGE